MLEPLGDCPVPLGAPALDTSSPLTIGAVLLEPLSLESLRKRLATARERDYLGITSTEPPRTAILTMRSLIGDAIVPRDPHAAGRSAASEAL